MTFWTENRRMWVKQFARGTVLIAVWSYLAIGLVLGSVYVYVDKWNKGEPGYHPRNIGEAAGFVALMTVAWPVIAPRVWDE